MPQSFGLDLNRIGAAVSCAVVCTNVCTNVCATMCAPAAWWYWGQTEEASALA